MNWAKENISNMKECEIEYFWCDNMYFDGDCAWFIGSNINALFCLSYLTGQIEFVATVPESNIKKLREYRVLYKSRKYGFCFPDNGGRLLLYDISSKGWIEKEINNPDHARIGIVQINSGPIKPIMFRLGEVLDWLVSAGNPRI